MTTTVDELDLNSPEFQKIADAISGSVSTDEPPEYVPPTDGPVTLPGGLTKLVDMTPVVINEAWVRELTGLSEERIAKAKAKGGLTNFLNIILKEGIEKLGDNEPTIADLMELSNGDRDYLLLQISIATYGDKIEYEKFMCQGCEEFLDISFSKSEDIPIKENDESAFTVELRHGEKARVLLATGSDAQAIERAATNAEANTITLQRCVSSISFPDGTLIDGDEIEKYVRTKLGVADRQKILKEMLDNQPGPRLSDVVVIHEECTGTGENRVAVQFMDLFRGL